MRRNIKTILFLLPVLATFVSFGACQDMLETDSTQVVFEGKDKLSNPDEAFYMLNGILADVQPLGDRYVLFGELRGDLMNASAYATVSMKEIYEFSVGSSNEYTDKRDYYNVINNCNYAIQKMDTALVVRNRQVMMPAFAAIKAIRAWTYWQLALAYGEAYYMEKPILSLEESLAAYPLVGIDWLAEQLAKDLEPYAGVEEPGSSSSPGSTFIPIPLMLGDLYLYLNRYEQAAAMYYQYITDKNMVLSGNYSNRWTNNTFNQFSAAYIASYRDERVSEIVYDSNPQHLHSKLVNLTYNPEFSLYPAPHFTDSMSRSIYCYAAQSGGVPTVFTEGDLRGYIPETTSSRSFSGAYGYYTMTGMSESINLIYKFYSDNVTYSGGYDPNNEMFLNELHYLARIPIVRIPHVYLRYAEAVNRAGKPTLAFAVLKHGLNNTTVHGSGSITPVVDPSEIATGETWVHFENSAFDGNAPTASRGRGQGISKDTRYFVIPALPQKQDSIDWVEVQILNEMAAETAFEGNRFFDLLRVSRRRPNHPEFMAGKVAAKYDNPDAMKSKLMNMDAWHIK